MTIYQRRIPELAGNPYRLGRNVLLDDRSREFPYRGTGVIRTVQHMRRIPVLDQGSVGACTGFAGTYALGHDPRFPRLPVALRQSLGGDYGLLLYSDATQVDPWEGEWPPDDTGSNGISVCKVLKNRGIISRYEWTFSLEECLAALSDYPVMIGVAWYDSMFWPDEFGEISIQPGSVIAGGHEITLTGIDKEKQTVSFVNSWGPEWGDNGNAWMTWNTLGALLGDPVFPGDCCVPIVDGATPVKPKPWWQRIWEWLT